MEYFFYNKAENLVSISNSILKYFIGTSFHNSSKQLDEVLAKKSYSKIALMLFDGLGKSIIETHLSPSDFLRRKKAFEISSIFPPTTVAATTAICSGKYPMETGWLGWQQYFKNHNIIVDMFTNNNSLTQEHIDGPSLASIYCPYENICSILSRNNIHSESLYPTSVMKNGAIDLNDFFNKSNSLMKKYDKQFLYLYWPDPDKTIHKNGVNSPNVRRIVKQINKSLITLSKDNKDTLIIVLADHSLVDTKFFSIYEHDDFASTLSTIYSIDARSASFHIVPGKEEEFKKLFTKYYGNYFILKTKEEIINEKWFGEGTPHPLFEDFLGEFLATSISNYGFCFNNRQDMVAAHAGSLKEESIINVAILNI